MKFVIIINNNTNYIKYEVTNNKYTKIIKLALNYTNCEEAKEKLFKTIDNKLSKDFSLFYKIKPFIDNLN